VRFSRFLSAAPAWLEPNDTLTGSLARSRTTLPIILVLLGMWLWWQNHEKKQNKKPPDWVVFCLGLIVQKSNVLKRRFAKQINRTSSLLPLNYYFKNLECEFK
jgi:hypothetical protein